MKYYLKAHEALPEGVDRIIRGILDRSYKLLTDNEENPDIAVHELRKYIKKLRALLLLLSPGMSRKVFKANNRALRDFARLLNGARDNATLLVSLGHIKQHFTPFLDDSATAPLFEELIIRHEKALREQQDTIEITRIEDQLQGIATRLGGLDRFSFTLDTLLVSLEQCYRQGRRSLKALRKSPTARRSHDFREQVKTLWYQLRLMNQWNPEVLTPLIAELGKLGELLGKNQDMAALAATLPTLECASGNPTRIELLVSLAGSRHLDLLEQSLQLGNELYSRKTGRFMDWFRKIKLER
jgi:CHAD domain-containing protein